MAAKPAPKDKAAAGAATAKPGAKRFLIPGLIAVVVAIAAGGGVAFFMSKKATPPEPSSEVPAEAAKPAPKPGAKPEYIALEPPFVVNLADASGDRYLQVEVQLMSRVPKIADTVGEHMPVIRNRLLMLFSQQTVESVRSREAKEKLQADALKEVQAVLTEATGSEGVEALFFTSFVTQ